MTEPHLLVLDFDGVICDSVDECFASSWEAWQRMTGGGPVPPAPPGRREAFCRLRPFLRGGQDYGVIQWIAERGLSVADQAGFDAVAREMGEARLAEFRRRFYEARERMLAENRDRWLAMHRIYPHVREAFGFLDRSRLRILSTKKAPYILELLSANGIGVPADNVHYCPSGPKVPRAAELLEQSGLSRAVFVDDQVDFLLGAGDPRVDCYLASWGYVQPGWLTDPRVSVLDPPAFLALARRLAGRPPST
jgi:phosphoglycolate phosphatase-like HAD superfamily hydrolase